MNIEKTQFFDLLKIKHKVHFDKRGFFKEAFLYEYLDKNLSYKFNYCQENIVKSKRNVLRGLHYQLEPYSQSKLISVEIGKILDISVDMRKQSKTFGKYFSYILDSKKHESLFIPKGFAHGYLTISEEAIISYKVDNYYNKSFERIIKYDDPFLKINWGIDSNDLIISEKDLNDLNKFNWIEE